MIKKLNSTTLFIISFIVLIGLQAHYVYTSYKLEERKLNKQANTIADIVLKKLEKFDNNTDESEIVRNFKKLGNNPEAQKERIKNLKNWYTTKKYYQTKVDGLMAKETINTGLKIALKSEVYSILNKIENRELLNINDPIILFKTNANIAKGVVINQGTWNSNERFKDTEIQVDEDYHFIIKSKTTIEVTNIKFLILKKIAALLIVSIIITLLIAYLFFRSLKNIKIQEQKIAQLHTTIDSIAHELNTPLTTLKFTLASSSKSDTNTILERQVNRIEKVVSSIHQQNVESSILTKNELNSYLDSIKSRFSNLNFQTYIEFGYNHCLLKNDFEEIINNLIENSSKYKANAVKLDLKFGKNIVINACDDGIGIPQEEQEHIFEKYYRVTRPENMQINGLGLGLHIVKQIVLKYKGNIKVETNTNKGVTFKITLNNEH